MSEPMPLTRLGMPERRMLPVVTVGPYVLLALLTVATVAIKHSAVGSLRTLNTASVTYSTACGGFAPTLLALGPPLAACATADLIDAVLAAGTKSGYIFTYAAGAAVAGVIPTYTVNADPVTAGTTGQRHFFTDQSGVVRADPAAAATVASTPI